MAAAGQGLRVSGSKWDGLGRGGRFNWGKLFRSLFLYSAGCWCMVGGRGGRSGAGGDVASDSDEDITRHGSALSITGGF